MSRLEPQEARFDMGKPADLKQAVAALQPCSERADRSLDPQFANNEERRCSNVQTPGH